MKDDIRTKLVIFMGTKKAFTGPRLKPEPPKHKPPKSHRRHQSDKKYTEREGAWQVQQVDMFSEDYEYLDKKKFQLSSKESFTPNALH